MTPAASRLLERLVPAGLLAAGLLLALFVRLPAGVMAVLWASWLAACALWLRQGGGGVVGPVLVYDMVRQTRRARFFLVRLTYLLILFGVLCWTFWMWSLDRDVGRLPASELPAFAESFFSTYLVVQFLMVLVLTPAVTAGAIAEEKERRTLPFLLATDLHNREIVLGKLASRFSFLALALISGLPVLAILQLIGGVDPAWLLATFAGTLATAVSLAGVGVYWSTYLRRTRDATIVAYLSLPVYVLVGYGALAVLALVGDFPTDSESPFSLARLVMAFNAGNPILAYRAALTSLEAGGTPEMLWDALGGYALFHVVVAVVCLAASVWGLRRVALAEAGTSQGPRQTSARVRPFLGGRPEVSDTPMMWKEIYAERGLQLHWLARVALAAVVVLSFWPAVSILTHWDSGGFFDSSLQMNFWVRVTGTLVACLLLLGIAVRAAGSVVGERGRQTLDALLTSPLESEEILKGKCVGSVLSVGWGWVWLGSIWGLGVLSGGLHLMALPFLLLFWTLFASAAAVLGVWYSVNSATALRATVATLSTMLGLTLAPWLTLFCCGLLARGGGEGVALLASIQAGLSPPVSLALMAVHGQELSSGDRLGGYLAAGVTVGGIAWLFLTSAVWAATVKRFKEQTGRDGWQPEQMPPQDPPPHKHSR